MMFGHYQKWYDDKLKKCIHSGIRNINRYSKTGIEIIFNNDIDYDFDDGFWSDGTIDGIMFRNIRPSKSTIRGLKRLIAKYEKIH